MRPLNEAMNRFLGRYPDSWAAIDSHTLGEATRLLVGGVEIEGATMSDKRAHFRDNLDHVRCLLTREPRGHRDLLAAAVTEPTTPGAAFGLVYMDARRYPFLCGHATIGAVTTLVELGMIPPAEEILVDTPSGVLATRIRMEGERVAEVSLYSMPAFAYGLDQAIEVPGFGAMRVDTVCVGGYFVMVDAAAAGLDLSPERRAELIPLGNAVIDAANEQLTVRHPERPEVCTVDVVEFCREIGPRRGEGVVVYGESHIDRSPCGTGTTAKATLLHRKGKLATGELYENFGPLGTSFSAVVEAEAEVGSIPAVRVRIKGSAVVTGWHTFVLDPADPFPRGFLL